MKHQYKISVRIQNLPDYEMAVTSDVISGKQ